MGHEKECRFKALPKLHYFLDSKATSAFLHPLYCGLWYSKSIYTLCHDWAKNWHSTKYIEEYQLYITVTVNMSLYWLSWFGIGIMAGIFLCVHIGLGSSLQAELGSRHLPSLSVPEKPTIKEHHLRTSSSLHSPSDCFLICSGKLIPHVSVAASSCPIY